MIQIYQTFNDNIRAINEIGAVYLHLKDNLKLPNDLDDLLRAKVTQSVSAFDKFIHDVVRFGMLEIFQGLRPVTNGYYNFSIPLSLHNTINTNSSFPKAHWLDQEIQLRHSYISFQDVGKITEGLSLVWNEEHKWQKIADSMGKPQRDIKIEFNNIITRRNQIVHEFDIDLSTSERRRIEISDVNRTVNFIANLAKAIFECVK